MKTIVLHQKLARYLDGHAMPAEANQIQSWLSIVDKSGLDMSEEQKLILEEELLQEIQAYTAYPLFFPKHKGWKGKLAGFLQLK